MALLVVLLWRREEPLGLGVEATLVLKMYFCLKIEIFGKRTSHDHRNYIKQEIYKGLRQREFNDPFLSFFTPLL